MIALLGDDQVRFRMRGVAVALLLLVAFLPPVAAQTVNPSGGDPTAVRVSILGARMAEGHALRIELATAGLVMQGPEPPALTLAVWLEGAPIRVTVPIVDQTRTLVVDLDLQTGFVRVGGVAAGEIPPVPPFDENRQFPIEVTVRQGPHVATARQVVTVPLPTVIVPGYRNEAGGPDEKFLAALARHGYTSTGTSPTLFWFTYQSTRVTLEEAAAALATYVRRVVLPATYATKINIVAYSVGGLLARWNLAHDTDNWATLVKRLILVGVPHEGSVMVYAYRNAPSFLPFSGLARTPVAATLAPTFPFWRAKPTDPWGPAPDQDNPVLRQFNTQPLPSGIRTYLIYGNHDPNDPAGPQTMAGVTGRMPGGELVFGRGDGVVLAASAQGLSIHGGPHVPSLAGSDIVHIDLGSVNHYNLLPAGADKIAAALLDVIHKTGAAGPARNARSILGRSPHGDHTGELSTGASPERSPR